MSKQLIPAQRFEQIRNRLEITKVVTNAELCELLGISEATVRRDLEWLEKQGVLERTHGGAILSQRLKSEPEYAARALAHPDEKRSIGATAAALIEDGDTIFVNSGTTATQVIGNIPSRAKVTVVTNNLTAALQVHNAGFELILLGGTFYPRSNAVIGHFASENLRRLNANKTFIGADGISLKYGYTVPSNPEAELVRAVIADEHPRRNAEVRFVMRHRRAAQERQPHALRQRVEREDVRRQDREALASAKRDAGPVAQWALLAVVGALKLPAQNPVHAARATLQ